MSEVIFRCRASAVGKIMGGTFGASEAQLRNIKEMDKREKPMTLIQAEKYAYDCIDRDANKPPEGAANYVKDWLKEQLYGTRKEFSSKYTDKGNTNENIAIEMTAQKLEHPMLLKNDEYFENEYVHGTPDLVLPDTIIDVKCSWDAFTFPLFEDELPNKDYYWQIQTYMWLTGRTSGKVVYCLTETDYETPEYDNVDDKLKVKVFDVDFDPEAIEKIKERINECNEYLETIKQK